MRSMKFMTTTLAALVLALPAAAEYSFEVADKEPPAELRDAVRSELEHKSYSLLENGEVFYEFWFVNHIEAAEDKGNTKDTLDTVEPVSLLGAVIVHQEERYDFREDPIDPGTYVMRYSLQPQDGNHMGTSPYDTFLIFVPLDLDPELDKFFDHELMVELALEPTASAHPPILALQPMESAEGDFPRRVTAFRPEMAVHGRFGQPCPVCSTAVQRIRYRSHETNYCPTCQTGGRILADRSLSRLLREDWPRTLEELEERFGPA